MYEAYYNLTEKPFSILPDPEFIYWGRAHSMAFAMLEYGIMNHAGFTVITGEIGCGKTTLIRHLLNRLDDNITVGLVTNTPKNSNELLQWIMMALNQPINYSSYVELYQNFEAFIIGEYAKGRRTVIIIDEAQNLEPETLEELRMFSNLNADKSQLLQLVLVGQPELKNILQRPELVQFAQRVSSDFHLRRLLLGEVIDYINHRLWVAGRQTVLFTEEACEIIAKTSNGIPRIINILCDTALIYGFSWEAPEITRDIVQDVIKDKSEFGIFAATDNKDPRAGDESKVFQIASV
jgi:general secretion pathway protein A